MYAIIFSPETLLQKLLKNLQSSSKESLQQEINLPVNLFKWLLNGFSSLKCNKNKSSLQKFPGTALAIGCAHLSKHPSWKVVELTHLSLRYT